MLLPPSVKHGFASEDTLHAGIALEDRDEEEGAGLRTREIS